MNQSQFLAITCNSLEARERSRVHGTIVFGLASHWLKNWRESFKPITKRSNRNHGITFDSHLKTALLVTHWFQFSQNRMACLVICDRKSDHYCAGSLGIVLDACAGTVFKISLMT